MKLDATGANGGIRTSRKCVFCGAGKLSAEHIWSAWARDLLPTSDGYQELTNGHRGGKAIKHQVLRDAQGSITNKRLKRVCQPCNNAWMGRQEQRAKPVVTQLISAAPTMLAKDDRHALVNWIVTKLIVLDVFRDGEQVFTEAERFAFRQNWIIPKSLSVWLLRCGEGPWRTLFWSHAQRLTIVEGVTWEKAKPPPGAGPNLKLWLWGFGDALIVACYTGDLDLDLGMQDEFAIQLVPDQGIARRWPTIPVSATDATALQRTLLDLATSMGGRVIEVEQDGETT